MSLFGHLKLISYQKILHAEVDGSSGCIAHTSTTSVYEDSLPDQMMCFFYLALLVEHLHRSGSKCFMEMASINQLDS